MSDNDELKLRAAELAGYRVVVVGAPSVRNERVLLPASP